MCRTDIEIIINELAISIKFYVVWCGGNQYQSIKKSLNEFFGQLETVTYPYQNNDRRYKGTFSKINKLKCILEKNEWTIA